MLNDLPGLTDKAFQSTHPKNPLNKLDDGDRMVLFVLLKSYAVQAEDIRRKAVEDDSLERAENIMAEVAKLATKLESEIFQGPDSDFLNIISTTYRDIPKRLAEFSMLGKLMLGGFGKPGHKAKILANHSLVMASVFVRSRIGQHFDEHLSELFQAIADHPVNEVFNGDAIRKRREFLKKHYPRIYEDALKSVWRACGSSTTRDPSSLSSANVGSGLRPNVLN